MANSVEIVFELEGKFFKQTPYKKSALLDDASYKIGHSSGKTHFTIKTENNITSEFDWDAWVDKYGHQDQSLEEKAVTAVFLNEENRAKLARMMESMEVFEKAATTSVPVSEELLDYQSVSVLNLSEIFGMYDLKIAISAITAIIKGGRDYAKQHAGKVIKFAKEGRFIVVKFPGSNDNNIDGTAPTYNRFVSYFGKDWGMEMARNNKNVCSAIGMKLGWHVFLDNEELYKMQGKNFGGISVEEIIESKWIFYTCTIAKSKPCENWQLERFEALVYLAFNLLNDMNVEKGRKPSDFFRKAMVSLSQLGINITCQSVLEFIAYACPRMIAKASNVSISVEDAERIVWAIENKNEFYFNKSVSVGRSNNKDLINNMVKGTK